jgi:N-acyl-D-aspartate/D-glutamate deacylase
MGKEGFVDADRKLLTELSLRSGRPVNFNELSQNSERPGVWRDQLAYMKEAATAGAQVYAVARYQRLDNLFNLKSVDSFTQWPRLVEVLLQPDERRLELLRDPAVRAAMRDEADRHDSQDPPAARRLGIVSFLKSKTGLYREYEGLPLSKISGKTGKHPVDIIVDWSLDEDEQAEFAFIGVLNGDLNAVAEIIHSPYAIAGISDAGAHTDRVSGSYYSTFMLSHWVRDMGVITLEDAIRRLAFIPASLYSLWDRGQIREGFPADIVVFNLDALEWLPTERFHDFPGGESRLGNRAKGYDYLIVDGRVVMDHGEDAGERPGRVLRSGDYRYNGR